MLEKTSVTKGKTSLIDGECGTCETRTLPSRARRLLTLSTGIHSHVILYVNG